MMNFFTLKEIKEHPISSFFSALYLMIMIYFSYLLVIKPKPASDKLMNCNEVIFTLRDQEELGTKSKYIKATYVYGNMTKYVYYFDFVEVKQTLSTEICNF